jgi:hypothetical protein
MVTSWIYDVANVTSAMQVLAAASFLQMPELLSECGAWLISKMSRQTWLRTLQISHTYGLPDVQQAVYKYIVQNFNSRQKLLKSSTLCKLNLEDICAILEDDDINASEKAIFNIALSWLKCNGKEINQLVDKILSLIRFPLMSAADLEMCGNELSDLSLPVDSYCQLLEESRSFIAGSRSYVLTDQNMRPRCQVDAVLALGGFTKKEYSTSCMQLLSFDDFMSSAERIYLGEVDSIRLLLVFYVKTSPLCSTVLETYVCSCISLITAVVKH